MPNITREIAKNKMYDAEERVTGYSVAINHADNVIDEIFDSIEKEKIEMRSKIIKLEYVINRANPSAKKEK